MDIDKGDEGTDPKTGEMKSEILGRKGKLKGIYRAVSMGHMCSEL